MARPLLEDVRRCARARVGECVSIALARRGPHVAPGKTDAQRCFYCDSFVTFCSGQDGAIAFACSSSAHGLDRLRHIRSGIGKRLPPDLVRGAARFGSFHPKIGGCRPFIRSKPRWQGSAYVLQVVACASPLFGCCDVDREVRRHARMWHTTVNKTDHV